jgi:folate-binding protein YgfZ
VANLLPLHDLHVKLGAEIAAPCGVDLPISYGDPAAEHRAVRAAVGVIDRSHYGVIEATGQDRVSFLNGMLTNDIVRLRPGQGCGAAFLDAHGKVQLLLVVLALADRLLLIVPTGLAVKTREALEKFHFAERVEMRDASDEWAMFMLAGPKTAAAVGRLTGAPLPEAPWQHTEAAVRDIPVRLLRGSGETGAGEAWLLGRREDGAALLEAILAAGASPVGLTALDALRVEAGTPWFGHDVDDTALLPEVPFEPLVSYTKGCYIGQEVIVRVRDRGHVNRLLTGLTLEGESVPRPGSAIVADGKEVGRITSAVRSFELGRPIALGFVRREHATPGSAVRIRSDGGELAARVTALPFVRGV